MAPTLFALLSLLSSTQLAVAPVPPPPPTSTPLLLRSPTVSRTQICFSYGGDLWTVDRTGGAAKRLTTGAGIEKDPSFSPDGTLIAFTGNDQGNDDVFVVPASGGQPKRLTSHPGGDQVIGWTPDGHRVLFRSGRQSYSRFDRLFTVGLDGGLPEVLPLPKGEQASFSPDMSHLAYTPFSNFIGTTQRVRAIKHYRGGTASVIWVANLADSSIERVPRQDSNDSYPMWMQDERFSDRIYFLTDRSGPSELWVYDTKTKAAKRALQSNGQDIKSASAGPDAIVYEQLGSLHLFDPASGHETPVEIHFAGDFAALRPHYIPVGHRIENAAISPTGQRAVFEAHGEILTVPAERGDVHNLTRTPGVAERSPAWSPDGKWIAYFSDASGEYQLMLVSQDGWSEKKVIDLGEASFFYAPVWSPDSKRIAYSDKRLNLWYVDVAGGKPVKVETAYYEQGPGGSFQPTWSPDSRYLAYNRVLPSGYHALMVYSPDERRSYQLTDGLSDASSPAFDKNGKLLYFLASTDVGPTIASSMSGYHVPTTNAGYVVVLQKRDRSPLAPRSDDEKIKGDLSSGRDECRGHGEDEHGSDKDRDGENGSEGNVDSTKAGSEKKPAKPPPLVRIDFADIGQRILALPLPSRNYANIVPGESHVLFLLEGAELFSEGDQVRYHLRKFDLCTQKNEQLLSNVGAFMVSADGKKALYEELGAAKPGAQPSEELSHGGRWFIRPLTMLGKPPSPGNAAPMTGPLRIDEMKIKVDPPAQWAQIFAESVRIERDFFYDPNMHGANLKALATAYRRYLPGVVSRDDLTYLLGDMFSDITAQHLYIANGEMPGSEHVAGGLLGADYRIESGRYRIAKIYHGENWNVQLHAPLTEPGVDVHEGDFIISIDGRPLTATDDIDVALAETAGKTVMLEVAAVASGKPSRRAAVVPIADEHPLRNHEWIEANRELVDKLSQGQLAYVYLPDTHTAGFTAFNRYYFSQTDKAGAVIDERFNAGGWIADHVIDWLSRPQLMMAMTREGHDESVPKGIFGPKVMLINEQAGSGGDALPAMFRQQKLGPLIGTRTWGGLIGIGGYPSLIDGGSITAPRWALYNPKTGEFDVENKGVTPDIGVEFDPAEWRRGHDPQLEKAVATALELLKEHPLPTPRRPKYPVYDWPRARAEAAAH